MKAPAAPSNERARLHALSTYAVLDTPAEPAFDALTTLAAHIAEVPIALVSLVDVDRQWFKSRYGLDAPETPRDVSFCGHVVASEQPLIVADAFDDARFADNPLVVGEPRVRFYAGMPLTTQDGFVLGTLCAIDHRARALTDAQHRMLELLARQVVDQLELRRRNILLHTQQRALEQTLERVCETGSRLQSILESVNYAIIETTEDGIIREFNRAAERMLGYAASELVGKATPGVFHDPEEIVARSAELTRELGTLVEPGFETFVARVRRGEADEREWTYVRKDGSRLPVDLSVTSRLDDSGKVVGFLGIASDITGRHKAEALLRESESRSRAIIETAVDAIVTIDENGWIDRVNPAVQQLFGHRPEALVGAHIDVLTPASDGGPGQGHLVHWLSTHDRRGVAGGREVLATRNDGTQFPAELTVSELSLEGRRFYTGLIRDLSDQKRVERLQSEFVSTVSHELRTPLTSIRGALGLIAGGVLGELSDEVKDYVGIALSNSERLVRLVNDILDMEKIQSGSMEFRLRATELASAVTSAIAANTSLARAQGVQLRLLGDPASGEALVDPDRLAQVLTNLISNAVKFAEPETFVDLAVERLGERLRVSVRDRGPGLPMGFESRIFQRFAQADSSSTREKGGTGLGLSISKAIIEKMRGNIGFESALGGGTRFFFDLPYLAPVEQARGEAFIKRVLVCEDDPDAARLLETWLASIGYAAHIAPTIERARRLLAQHRYEAITLDLVLADGDGSVLISELCLNEATKLVPIVVVSGIQHKLGSAALLVSDVLTKPFDEGMLISSVRRAVERARREHPTLLHVEDDADIRRIVQKSLPDNLVIAGADSVRAARHALSASEYDVVLLDLALPDGAGEDLLPLVGSAEVIIFSAADASIDLARRVSAALVKARSTPLDVRDTILSLITERAQNPLVAS